MLGALVKSYYAEKPGVDPKDLFVVSVMPCTAKKYEIQRPELASLDGVPDVDAVLTTRRAGPDDQVRRHRLCAALPGRGRLTTPLGLSTGARRTSSASPAA